MTDCDWPTKDRKEHIELALRSVTDVINFPFYIPGYGQIVGRNSWRLFIENYMNLIARHGQVVRLNERLDADIERLEGKIKELRAQMQADEYTEAEAEYFKDYFEKGQTREEAQDA